MGVKFFGQYLLEKGKITSEQLLEAVEHQKGINISIGTVALEKELLRPEQIEKVHREQYRTDKKFGEIAVDMGYLTPLQLDHLLKAQMSRRVFLGEALVQKKFLTLEELEEELRAYREEQEKDETEVLGLLTQVKQANVVEAFVDLVIKMFLRLSREFVKIGGCHTNKDNLLASDWTISQSVGGDTNFIFLLTLPRELLLRTASRMMQKGVDEPTEYTLDAVKEFCNIITGNACSKLSAQGLKLKPQPPVAYDNSSPKKYVVAKEHEIVAVPLASTVGELEVVLEF